MAEVLIEGRRLDVMQELDFSFNYSIADVRDPSKRSTSFSKTIQCPSNPNNDLLFGQIYDVNISNPYDSTQTNIGVNFNPHKKAKAVVTSDGVEVMSGIIQLRRIRIKSNDYQYEVVFIGNVISVFSKFKDKRLNGYEMVSGARVYHIDLSDLDHTYTRANQQASWSAAIGVGYVYPLIDFGFSYFFTSAGERIYNVIDLNPAIYTKDLIDRMFAFAGFTYTSTFFDSAFFKRLIIPTTKAMRLPDVTANTRTFKAVKTIPQMLHRLSTTFPNTYGNEQHFVNSGLMAKLCFEDEVLLGFDNNDQYQMLSSPNNLFNFDADGNYVFKCQEPQRNDVFRASIDLKLTNNHDFGAVSYFGDMELVHLDSGTSTINVISSVQWQWTLASVGTVQTKTVYIEGQVLTNLNDQVYIRLNAPDADSGYKSDYNDTIGSTVKLDFRCVGGYFENDPVQDQLYQDDTVIMSDTLPDVGMSDFFMGIIRMFNLYLTPDPNNETNILIETRDDFYLSGITRDWTDKLARDRNIGLEPLGLLAAGEYIYSYSEDGDYYNNRYQTTYGHPYGRRRIDVDNDFLNNTSEVKVVFSPTPLVNDNPSNRIIPKIYDADIDDDLKPTDSNVRILYYGGLLPSDPVWYHKSTLSDNQTSVYPYAGHLTHPISPAQDINFGLTQEIYYSENSYTGPILVTNNNLYKTFHRKGVGEITGKDSKLLTGMFNLTPWDISKLDFRDQILIDNSYWRLNKVVDYNPFKEGLTKVELIKVSDVVALEAETATSGSNGTLGNGNGAETTPLVAARLKRNLNGFPDFQGSVSGQNNRVGDSSRFFRVVGSDNKIGEGCENITVIGNTNNIADGLSDVTVINTDGLTITESNTTIIDGKRQWVHVDKDDDYTAMDREFVLCDCTSKVVTITLPPVADSTDVRIQVLKTDVSASGVVVDGDGSETINGATTYNLGSQYDFVSVWCDGVEWFITE